MDKILVGNYAIKVLDLQAETHLDLRHEGWQVYVVVQFFTTTGRYNSV